MTTNTVTMWQCSRDRRQPWFRCHNKFSHSIWSLIRLSMIVRRHHSQTFIEPDSVLHGHPGSPIIIEFATSYSSCFTEGILSQTPPDWQSVENVYSSTTITSDRSALQRPVAVLTLINLLKGLIDTQWLSVTVQCTYYNDNNSTWHCTMIQQHCTRTWLVCNSYCNSIKDQIWKLLYTM